MNVWVFDPGLMTGVANWQDGEVHSWEWTTNEVYHWVSDVGNGNILSPDVIVSEAFVVSMRTVKGSFQPWSLELIGLLRFIATCEEVPFELQQASAAKMFTKNDDIRALGWWHAGGEGHALDALRHLRLYLVKARLLRP